MPCNHRVGRANDRRDDFDGASRKNGSSPSCLAGLGAAGEADAPLADYRAGRDGDDQRFDGDSHIHGTIRRQ